MPFGGVRTGQPNFKYPHKCETSLGLPALPAPGRANPEVHVVGADCGCADICSESSIYVMAVTYRDGTEFVEVELLPLRTGPYKVCAGGEHVAARRMDRRGTAWRP